jgi:hypothetical protein
MIQFLAVALPMLTIGLFTWFYIRSRRPRKPKTAKDDHRTRQERAVWAWATVVTSASRPVNAVGMARVEMQLDVHMPGTPAYRATTTWMVEEEALAFVQQGKEIALKVDPLGLQYVYPNGSWAKFVE